MRKTKCLVIGGKATYTLKHRLLALLLVSLPSVRATSSGSIIFSKQCTLL